VSGDLPPLTGREHRDGGPDQISGKWRTPELLNGAAQPHPSFELEPFAIRRGLNLFETKGHLDLSEYAWGDVAFELDTPISPELKTSYLIDVFDPETEEFIIGRIVFGADNQEARIYENAGIVGPAGATGATGTTGDTGPQGPQGDPGEGVAAGGTIGQVLTKASSTDYDTYWDDAGGPGPQGDPGPTGPHAGAVAIHYAFDTSTSDSDPGSGALRLNASPQDGATFIYLDVLDDEGVSWQTVIDTLDDSSSLAKGHLRLVKRDDLSAWILFQLHEVVTATGYRKLDVSVVEASSSSPFSASDPIVLHFTRTGDKGADGITAEQLAAASIVAVFDGGGAELATGEQGYLEVPFECEIVAARLFADQAGDLVVDVWRDTYAAFPPTDADSITASAPPTLSSGQKSEDTTLTGWTTALAQGDVLAFNIDSVADVTRATLSLTVERV